METKPTVLVTGGTGFLGAHCILLLLQNGYSVKTTIRSISRKADVLQMLKVGGITATDNLQFVEADLTKDANWPEATRDCRFVWHVASPYPATPPKDENDLIAPAVDGTLRVLRAAKNAKVEKVVLTSSFAAIGYGQPYEGRVFTENDWTPLDGTPPVQAYQRSKTLAERAAWDFIAREDDMELSVINPVGIFGPVLGPDHSTSTEGIQKLLTGLPGVPKASINVVDVRDVASLHLLAMINPAASGERFLAAAGEPVSLKEMAVLLKNKLGDAGKRIPTRELPNWLVRMAANFEPTLASVVPVLGKRVRTTHEKATRVLGWKPRSNEEALVATAESLLRLGLVKQ